MNFLMELWNVFCFLFLGLGSLFFTYFFIGGIFTINKLAEKFRAGEIAFTLFLLFVLDVLFITLFKVKFL